jgi:hypothetical protein
VLGPEGGVSYFEGERWKSLPILQDVVVNAILFKTDGDVWFGTWGQGVLRYVLPE